MDREIRGRRRRKRRKGEIAASFLFNPMFTIIPLSKAAILEKDERKRGGRGRPEGELIWEIKCRSLKFVVLVDESLRSSL